MYIVALNLENSFICYMLTALGSWLLHSKIYSNNLCASNWRMFINIRLVDCWTISTSSFQKIEKPHFSTDIFKMLQCDWEFTNFFIYLHKLYIFYSYFVMSRKNPHSFWEAVPLSLWAITLVPFNADRNLPNTVFNAIIYLITLHRLVFISLHPFILNFWCCSCENDMFWFLKTTWNL